MSNFFISKRQCDEVPCSFSVISSRDGDNSDSSGKGLPIFWNISRSKPNSESIWSASRIPVSGKVSGCLLSVDPVTNADTEAV